MFSLSAWVVRRQAKDLLRHGQLEQASRLLASLAATGHRRAVALQRAIAQAYLDRATRYESWGEPELAWADLHAAEALVPGVGSELEVRKRLTATGLEVVAKHLVAAQPVRALDALERLRSHRVAGAEWAALRRASEAMLEAQLLADRGEFESADRTLKDADAPGGVVRLYEERAEQFRPLLNAAAAAAEDGRWADCAAAADGALALAPSHAGLRELRLAAWTSLRGQPAHVPSPNRTTRPYVEPAVAPPQGIGRTSARLRTAEPVPAGGPLPKRFALWVDGVGGYLVCLAPRVTLGQAMGEAPVDVPIFAEIGKLHAELTRDDEGVYLLESQRDTRVNGDPATRRPVQSGDRVTLGTSCQLVFHQPVPLSTTARLDVVSGHRLPWAVDGVILMGQSLVLGGPHGGHVPGLTPDAPPVALFRTPTGLAIKCPGRFRIETESHADRADLALPSVVMADGLTFAVEPLRGR